MQVLDSMDSFSWSAEFTSSSSSDYGTMLLSGWKLIEKLRWPEPIYMHVGYILEWHFSAGTIKPISMIFGIINKEWNFKKIM